MAFLDFLLILFFVVLPVAAICTQVVPRRLGSVVFRETDLAHAWLLVGQYAEGTFEQRFGYPTGYFYVDEQRSQEPARVLVREAQPAGAITDGCSAEIGAMSMSGFEGGLGAGCTGCLVFSTIGAPFLFVSFFDRMFRLVLRSRVDVRLAQSGDDVVASFAFYGPGGYSLLKRYSQVFEKPALPAEIAMEAPVAGAPAVAGVVQGPAGQA